MNIESRNHLDYIDGLRALCALFVVLHHTYQDVFMVGPTHTLGGLGSVLGPFAYGHLAVGIFIVISGFCLTLPCGATLSMRQSIAEFYASRAWRILPPLFAALVLGLIVKLVIRDISASKSFAALPANFMLLQDVIPHFNVLNGPSWSVAVEFKIYLAFPLLLLLYRRYNDYVVWLVTGAFGLAISAGFETAKSDFNLINFCPWFLLLFSMGIWAAKRSMSGKSSRRVGYGWLLVGAVASTTLLVFYPITRSDDFRFTSAAPFLDTAIGILTAAAIVLIHAPRGALGRAVRKLLSLPYLVWMGKRSYSLYLVHFPLLLAIKFLLVKQFPRQVDGIGLAFAMFFIGIPACIVFTAFFFRQIESHFLKLPPGLRKRLALGTGVSEASPASAAASPLAGTAPANFR